MTEKIKRFRAPKLVGGSLCLDFANSLYWRASDEPFEWFTSYSELLRWSKAVGVISSKDAASLEKLSKKHPRKSATTRREAIELRELIYKIFHKVTQSKRPQKRDVEALNEYLSRFSQHQVLSKTPNGYEFGWRDQEKHLDSMLWPIARSAAELLTSDEASRVGQCPGDDCGWLFVDRSRRGNRRWCDMNDCGHRHNAKMSYRRTRNN